jgi:Zn-dependent peptidase ImmA (M78 family)
LKWEYTWKSSSTIKKRKLKTPKRTKSIDIHIDRLFKSLEKTRPIKLNYTNSGGASYKYIYVNSDKVDWINIPHWNRFTQRRYFYKTLLHEISHCIMDRTLLSQQIDNIDDEEITVEFAAMFLCIMLGINTWKESYRYIRDYMINDDGFVVHEGRRDYIRKSIIRVLEYAIKIQKGLIKKS